MFLHLETKRRPTRVLRARGIPSYTEQFLSDNSETEELERWTEFEATYTSPNAPINSSTLLPQSQLDKPDKRTDPEDSDQEWILPSSRRKRRKRQCKYLFDFCPIFSSVYFFTFSSFNYYSLNCVKFFKLPELKRILIFQLQVED